MATLTDMDVQGAVEDLMKRHHNARDAFVSACKGATPLAVVKHLADLASPPPSVWAAALAHCASARRSSYHVDVVSFLRSKADCDAALEFAISKQYRGKTLESLLRGTTVEGRSRAYANAYEITAAYGDHVRVTVKSVDYDFAVMYAASCLSLQTVQHLAPNSSPKGLGWALAAAIGSEADPLAAADPAIREFLEGTKPDYDHAVMHAFRHEGWGVVEALMDRSSPLCRGWLLFQAFHDDQMRICDAIKASADKDEMEDIVAMADRCCEAHIVCTPPRIETGALGCLTAFRAAAAAAPANIQTIMPFEDRSKVSKKRAR